MANNLTLSVTLTGDGRQLTGTLRNAQGEVREFGGTTERESARAERALEGTGQQAQTVSGHLNQLRTVAIGVGAALTAMGVSSFANDTYQAVSSSQQLQASLKTVTGSIANASAAWNTLLGFAAETPFTLDQSVQAFIRMQSLGLKPSQEALRSYGNTAAAMGKDMMQMVEAVADATTGEFERLKEFGIRASKEGEQVSFTFQGVTTTVANSASAISQYLQEIGELQFAGAMADQMDTLSGKASNLEDTIYQFYLAIGDAGATGVFEATLANASSTVQFLTDNIDTLASGAEILAVLVGGRVAVALTTATTAMVAKTLATQADLRAEAAAAVANTRRTAAEKQTALALLSTARLEAQATQGTAAHTFALQQLSVARTRAATAAGAHTAAMNTATAATARASVAARGLSGALALVGGPLGLLVGGAGLLYLFRDELGLTVPQVDANTTAVNKLTNGLDDMSQAAAQLTLTSLVGQLAEVRAQAEVTAEAFTKVGQIEGDGGGGFLGVDVTAQTNAVRELGETSNATQQEAANLEAAIALVESRIGQLGERNREVTPTVTEIGDASETAAAKAKEMAKAASEQADAIEALRNRLVPHRRETVQLAQDQNTLNLAFAMGRITASEYLYMIGALQTAYIEAQNDADDLATSTTNALYTMEGAMEELRTNGLRRLDDGFADLWQGAIDGSLNASEIMKRVLSQTLAELAHMAITRPITVQLATSMGLGGGGQQASMGSSGGFGINPMSLGGAGQAFGNAFRAFQGTGSTYAGTFGAELAVQTEGGLRAGFNSFANSGFGSTALGVGGGFIGSKLGGAVFGESQEQQIGSTLGGLAGQVLIPIPGLGAGIGSFLGSAVGSLFGSRKTPPQFELMTAAQGVDPTRHGLFENYGEGVYSQGALGTVGFYDPNTARLEETFDGFENAKAFLDQITAMDNALAGVSDSEQELSAMAAAAQAVRLNAADAAGIADQLASRTLAVVDVIDGDFSASLRGLGLDAEQITARVVDAATAMQLLENNSTRLNLQFNATAEGALSAAGNLSSLVGGSDNLNSLFSGFYDAFYTQEEKFNDLADGLSSTFDEMGRELPTTREGVRELVEGLELMGTAGQEQLATILQLNQPLAQYIAAMEEQRAAAVESGEAVDDSAESMRSLADIARERTGLEREWLQLQGDTDELRRRELAALDESNRPLQERIWALKDERAAAEEATRAQQQLMSGVESAWRGVTQSITAERQILDNAYRDTTASINRNIQTVQEALQTTESISQSLQNALRDTQRGTAFAREQGQATLRAMISAGAVTNQRDLDNALSAVAEPSEQLFGTFLDYQRDFVGTAHDIYTLSQLTDDQLTNEEKSLRALERQLETADMQHQREMSRLDGILESGASQLEALFGQQTWLESINGSVMSVETAINALESSIAAAAAASSASSSAGGGGSGSSGSNSGLTNEQIKQFANNAVAENGGDWDAAGIAIGNAAIAAGVTSKQLAAALGKNEQDVTDRIAELGLPQFRDGGIASGPNSGYPVELHGPEAVVPLPNGRSIPVELRGPLDLPPMPFFNQQSNGSNDMAVLIKRVEVLAEQSKLQGGMQREALKALKALVRQLERWDDQDRVRVSVEQTVEPTA